MAGARCSEAKKKKKKKEEKRDSRERERGIRNLRSLRFDFWSKRAFLSQKNWSEGSLFKRSPIFFWGSKEERTAVYSSQTSCSIRVEVKLQISGLFLVLGP